MRVKLITDGMYNCMKGVELPVVVEGTIGYACADLVSVTSKELIRIGAKGRLDGDVDLCFEIDTECEVMYE